MRALPAALLIASCAAPQRAAEPPTEASVEVALPRSAWPADKQAQHVLNRLAYGPSPGDLAEVKQLGAKAWIDRQLYPERIADDAIAARLTGFETLAKTSGQ